MLKAVMTNVREVDWSSTNEYDFQVNGQNFKVRILENRQGIQEFWFDGQKWLQDGFPEVVIKFFEQYSNGIISPQMSNGDSFDLERPMD